MENDVMCVVSEGLGGAMEMLDGDGMYWYGAGRGWWVVQ